VGVAEGGEVAVVNMGIGTNRHGVMELRHLFVWDTGMRWVVRRYELMDRPT